MVSVIIILIIAILVLVFVIMNQKKKITSITEQVQKDINAVQLDAQEKVRAAQSAFEKEKADLSAQHTYEMNMMRQNFELEKQHAKDRAKEEIESRKSVLSQMDDKEMLTNILLALDGYGTRLNRIENYFVDDKIIEQTTRMFQDTTNKIDAVKRGLAVQLDDMCDSVTGSFNESDFKNKIEYICTYMREIDSDTNDKITKQTTRMFQDLTEKVEDMTGKLTNQIDGVNRSVEQSLHGYDLKNTIENIGICVVGQGQDIEEIKSSVCSGYGTNIAEDIDGLKNDVDSIKGDVDSIKNDVYSIKSNVGSIESDVDSIKDSVDDIHSDMSDKYSYGSLASTIEEIKEAVNDTKDAVESRLA